MTLPRTSAKLLEGLLLAVASGFAAYVATWAWMNIRADYPMEYRENAMLLSSELLVGGNNPYALEYRPAYLNLYGIGYFWACYPAAVIFGNTFLVLRVVSFGFLFGTVGLLLLALRVEKCSWPLAVAGALILFGELGQGLSIVARPDSLGLFLFLASVLVAYRFRFSPAALALSVCLSLLAFLTKAYFAIALPLVVVYVFVFESKLKGLLFGAFAVASALFMVWAINSFYECYFTDTFSITAAATMRSWQHLGSIAAAFAAQNIGFLIVAVAGLASTFALVLSGHANSRWAAARDAIDVRNLRQPLSRVKISLPTLVLVCDVVVIALVLGLHPGNDNLYYYQLISPFLIWIAFRTANQKVRWNRLATVFLLLNTGLQASHAKLLPHDGAPAWQELAQLVNSHTNVFTAPHLSHLLSPKGARVYDDGHTYAVFTALSREPSRIPQLYRARSEELLAAVWGSAQRKEFDLVLISHGLSPMLPEWELKKYYVSKGLLAAPMTFGYWVEEYPLEMWVPLPSTNKAVAE